MALICRVNVLENAKDHLTKGQPLCRSKKAFHMIGVLLAVRIPMLLPWNDLFIPVIGIESGPLSIQVRDLLPSSSGTLTHINGYHLPGTTILP
jgi:hypothetical protein